MRQTVLDFKIEKTEEHITPNSGLSIYIELYKAAKVEQNIRELFPKPGSAKGFEANVYVLSILLLFLAGGKYIEDIKKIKLDKALKKIGRLSIIPTADAIGDWMRNDSAAKIQAIEILHRRLTKRFLKQILRRDHTLDIDAFEIVSGKDTANYTYKGQKGYMPIAGHLAEADWCVGYEFREGQVPPADRNYQFILKCINNMPKGHQIARFRSDSAAYQSKIFNYLDQKGIKFTITGVHTTNIMIEIEAIEEQDWKPVKNKDGFSTDREVAESYACMENTEYFRITVQRWPNPKKDLFNTETDYCYHIICTNYSKEEKDSKAVIEWHNQRANSENYHKEAKGGFNLGYMPCDDFEANAIWFALGLMAYNMHIFAKEYLLPQNWRKKTIASIRWLFINIAGKVVNHSRNMILKLAGIDEYLLEIFEIARRRCWLLSLSP